MATITTTPVQESERPAAARKAPRPSLDQATAESAECNCPDFCERDHDRD